MAALYVRVRTGQRHEANVGFARSILQTLPFYLAFTRHQS